MVELTVVMPVYNEEACIKEVLTGWERQLEGMGLDYEMLVLDDGSRDTTASILEELAARRRRFRIVGKPNSGHGPTILHGYRQASGAWVFQVDSDGDIGPEDFPKLWARREDYDLLLGIRLHRQSPWSRRIITALSRMTVWLLFGSGVADVNCPYRLWRGEVLHRLLTVVPANTFAPNLILSGLAVRAGLRIHQEHVRWQGRRTGKVSMRKWALWKSALTAFMQTVEVACRVRTLRTREEGGNR